ncbi:CocE/NonD family hydrolase [Actinopolymorpha pittospori]|uniref:Pimeloyl-ACP methyl ester carboxylesterase n=1 Tax=Actinopolymorpha pittospori TaxID=648752 RepID=A0A927N3L6_9ACTN|nr:pimeloyl-ACP methyl ester carboxylesterase [Actinopolymorpha pittospori]
MAVVAPERPKRSPVLRRLTRRIGHRPVWRKPRRPLRMLRSATKVTAVALAVVIAPGGTVLGCIFRMLALAAVTFVVLRIEGRASLRRRSVLAIGVGAVGALAGFGIGVPHAAADGLSLRSAAGAVLVVVGVSLLVTGPLALARTVRRWRRVGVLVGSLAAALILLPPLVAAVAVTNPPPTHLDRLTPGDKGYPYDNVELRTTDGVLLRGWYIPSRNSAAVALVPDAGTTRSSVLPQAVLLAKHGYGVLLFDPRGNGMSEGDANDLGWGCERDINAAINFLANHYDVRRSKIAVIGLGRGGEGAITAGARDGRIRSVVAEGVGRRSFGDTLRLPDTPSGWLQRVSDSIEFAGAGVLRHSLPPPSLRRSIAAMEPKKLLLIANRGEIRVGQLYRRTSPKTVALWKLPDTPHLQAYAMRIAAWEDQVTSFLRTTLKPRQVPMRS